MPIIKICRSITPHIVAFSLLFLMTDVIAQEWPEPRAIFPPPTTGEESMLYRSAMNAESRGDYENAIKLYSRLRMLKPGKDIYLQGQVRCLTRQGDYPEAVEILQGKLSALLSRHPNDARKSSLLVDLGEVYLAWDKEDEAWSRWNQAISIGGKNPQVYRRISAFLMQKRMVDEAIEILKRGDARLRRGILSLDLARAYAALMDYGSATEYYLRYLEGQPRRHAYAERAIYAFPGDEETADAVISALESAGSPAAEKLLSGYLFSLGRYEESLERILLKEAKPEELLEFASQLTGEERYDLALKAYLAVEERFPNSRYSSATIAGMAECKYHIGEYHEALELFERLTIDYPRSAQSEKALYMMGEIFLERFNCPDSASIFFSRLRENFPKGNYCDQAGLMLGKCAVILGALEDANNIYEEILNTIPAKNVEIRAEAMLRLGRCHFWAGEVDSAVAIWDELSRKYPLTNAANDALNDLLCFKGMGDEKAVSDFSAAWFASAKRDFETALKGFKRVMETVPGTVLADRAALEAAEALKDSGKAESSLSLMEGYLNEHPEAELRDEIYFRMAEICLLKLNDKARAAYYYEQLLMEIPDSPLAPIVRRKLEEVGEVL